MNKTLLQDDAIFKSLDLKWIDRLVCITDRGNFSLKIRKGDTSYHLCLDSVPLDKKVNDELITLLFPKPNMEVPQVNKIPFIHHPEVDLVQTIARNVLPKSKGRPKGAKNR